MSKSHENTYQSMWIVTLFSKTWTKGHWPLDDLWTHVCWGHIYVTLPKDHCVQVPWKYITVCGYSDQFYKIPHTADYVQNEWSHMVSFWTQFRQDKNGSMFRDFLLKISGTLKVEGVQVCNSPEFEVRKLVFFWLPPKDLVVIESENFFGKSPPKTFRPQRHFKKPFSSALRHSLPTKFPFQKYAVGHTLTFFSKFFWNFPSMETSNFLPNNQQ